MYVWWVLIAFENVSETKKRPEKLENIMCTKRISSTKKTEHRKKDRGNLEGMLLEVE